MDKFEEVNNERAALAEQIEIMETSYAEERLKLEATKAQQTKLIDFLQYKTEGQNMKKKKVGILNIMLLPNNQKKGRSKAKEKKNAQLQYIYSF